MSGVNFDEAESFCPLCGQIVEGSSCPNDGAPAFRSSGLAKWAEPEAGAVIAGRYQLIRPLGSGAMGAVYEALQLGMNRSVALKLVKPELLTVPKVVQRFYREALAVSALSHPHIVRIYDFGIDAEREMPYLAFELIRGETLRARLDSGGPLPEARAAALVAQLAKALIAAHAQGLIHRDLKPENLMIERLPGGDEHLRVLDFGVVRIASGDLPPLTQAGVPLGTPRYMSPEQVIGEGTDARSDLYAVGCILHEILSGSAPFRGSTGADVMRMHFRDAAPALPERLVDGAAPSAALRALHAALLAKDVAARPANAEVVARALETIARTPSGFLALTPTASATPAMRTLSGLSTVEPVRARSKATRFVLLAALVAVALAGSALMAALSRDSGRVRTAPIVVPEGGSPPPEPTARPREPAAVATEPAPVSAPATAEPSAPEGEKKGAAAGKKKKRPITVW